MKILELAKEWLFCSKLPPHSVDVDPGVTMRQSGMLTPVSDEYKWLWLLPS